MATQAEVAELIGHIRATGHKVTKSGNAKHWKVLSPKGAVVVDDNGPLIISGSPSDNRFREMTVKRLLGAGVLKKDPYKATQSNPQEKGAPADDEPKKKHGGHHSRLTDPDVQARKVAAIQAKSKRYQERTAKLRARFEPIVVKLGGWANASRGSGVTTSELGDVVYHWAKNRGRMELPTSLTRGGFVSAESLRSPAQTLKTPGGTLGEKWLPLFEVFIDDLERDAGTPPSPAKAAERYMELLRTEVKGISPGPSSPRPLPPVLPFVAATTAPTTAPPAPSTPPPVRDTPEVEAPSANGEGGVVNIGPRYEPDTYIDAPQLALDALYEMAARSHPNDTEARERHMKLAKQIAELELNARGGTT